MGGLLADQSVDQLARHIRAFLAKNINNVSDLDDLLQSTLLQVVRSQQQLKDPAKLRVWALSIARNNLYEYRSRKKLVSWEDAVHDIDKRDDVFQKELHESVLSVIERCSRSDARLEQTIALALQLCFDWSVEEVATIMSSNTKTVYARIAKAKARMAAVAADGRVDKRNLAKLCNGICAFMITAGMVRVNGSGLRDSALVYQACWLARKTHEIAPDDFLLTYTAAGSCYILAKFAQYDSDDFVVELPLADWRRDKLDQSLVEAGDKYYRHLDALKDRHRDDPEYHFMRASAEYFHVIVSAASFETIDRPRLRALIGILDRFNDVNAVADIHEIVDGPAAAVKYLLSRKKGDRNSVYYCKRLARLYFQLQRWELAARWYRKTLRHPLSDSLKRQLQLSIVHCQRQLRKANRAKTA